MAETTETEEQVSEDDWAAAMGEQAAVDSTASPPTPQRFSRSFPARAPINPAHPRAST